MSVVPLTSGLYEFYNHSYRDYVPTSGGYRVEITSSCRQQGRDLAGGNGRSSNGFEGGNTNIAMKNTPVDRLL